MDRHAHTSHPLRSTGRLAGFCVALGVCGVTGCAAEVAPKGGSDGSDGSDGGDGGDGGGDSGGADDTGGGGGGGLSGDVAALLTTGSGCGDLILTVHDDPDRLLLAFQVSGPVAAAFTAGAPTTTTYTLPDAAVTLLVQGGERLGAGWCNDVVDDRTQVRTTWTATAGAASLLVTPSGEATEFEQPAEGCLTLDGATFVVSEGSGNPIEVSHLEACGRVGWLPG
jgi:hypothetical protein